VALPVINTAINLAKFREKFQEVKADDWVIKVVG
jgi:hypothetical protein